jgi:hypothetical protein
MRKHLFSGEKVDRMYMIYRLGKGSVRIAGQGSRENLRRL